MFLEGVVVNSNELPANRMQRYTDSLAHLELLEDVMQVRHYRVLTYSAQARKRSRTGVTKRDIGGQPPMCAS